MISSAVPAIDGKARRLHHMDFAASHQKSRQPKSFAARFMGQNNPRNRMTRRAAASFQPFDQSGQFLAARSRNMPCVALDARKLNGEHPFLLA